MPVTEVADEATVLDLVDLAAVEDWCSVARAGGVCLRPGERWYRPALPEVLADEARRRCAALALARDVAVWLGSPGWVADWYLAHLGLAALLQQTHFGVVRDGVVPGLLLVGGDFN